MSEAQHNFIPQYASMKESLKIRYKTFNFDKVPKVKKQKQKRKSKNCRTTWCWINKVSIISPDHPMSQILWCGVWKCILPQSVLWLPGNNNSVGVSTAVCWSMNVKEKVKRSYVDHRENILNGLGENMYSLLYYWLDDTKNWLVFPRWSLYIVAYRDRIHDQKDY